MADRLSPSTKTLPFLGLWKLIDVWSLFSAVSESQLPGDRACHQEWQAGSFKSTRKLNSSTSESR